MESVFNKVAGLEACNFIKKRFQHSCFPLKFAKFLRVTMWKTGKKLDLITNLARNGLIFEKYVQSEQNILGKMSQSFLKNVTYSYSTIGN